MPAAVGVIETLGFPSAADAMLKAQQVTPSTKAGKVSLMVPARGES